MGHYLIALRESKRPIAMKEMKMASVNSDCSQK